jgi:hypothetical protein
MFGNYYDIHFYYFLHLTMSFTVGSLRVQSQTPRAFCSVTSLPPGDVLLGACRKRIPSQLTVHASRFCVFLLVMTDLPKPCILRRVPILQVPRRYVSVLGDYLDLHHLA